MEHIVDELLSALSMSRSAVIYCGGGHCYFLLPNTQAVKDVIQAQQEMVNTWFMEHFHTELYIACGYAAHLILKTFQKEVTVIYL